MLVSNKQNQLPPPPPPEESRQEQRDATQDETQGDDDYAQDVTDEEKEEITYVSPGGIPQKQGPIQTRDESGSSHVARSLAPQLGSSPQILGRHQIDERKMAVLNDMTQTSLGYFAYRGKVDKVRFFRWISNWELVSSQAVGGLARRHILQAISASSGVTVAEVAGRPNIIARNISNRNWKEKAVRDGKVVVDGE